MPATTRKRKAQEEQPQGKAVSTRKRGEKGALSVSDGLKSGHQVAVKESVYGTKLFTITDDTGKDISCQSRKLEALDRGSATLIFTHGAGGGLDTPAMQLFAEGYAGHGSIVCFEGTTNLRSRVKSFETLLSYLQAEDSDRTFAVGGRSMGARAAVTVAQVHKEVRMLVLVSYPLTSAKGDNRDQILLDLPKEKEVLFVIGSNDTMCDLDKLKSVQKRMKAKSWLIVVDGADHGTSLTTSTPNLKNKQKSVAVEAARRMSGKEAAIWISNPSAFDATCSLDWTELYEQLIGEDISQVTEVTTQAQEIDESSQPEHDTQLDRSKKKRRKR